MIGILQIELQLNNNIKNAFINYNKLLLLMHLILIIMKLILIGITIIILIMLLFLMKIIKWMKCISILLHENNNDNNNDVKIIFKNWKMK